VWLRFAALVGGTEIGLGEEDRNQYVGGGDGGVLVEEGLVGVPVGWGTAKLEHRFASFWDGSIGVAFWDGSIGVAVGCTFGYLVGLGKGVRVGVLKVAVSERGL
jgi:hypothetical protein